MEKLICCLRKSETLDRIAVDCDVAGISITFVDRVVERGSEFWNNRGTPKINIEASECPKAALLTEIQQ